jgi:signal transduction histidine kinase
MQFSDYVDKAMTRNIRTASNMAEDKIYSLQTAVAIASSGIAKNQDVITAASGGDREALWSGTKAMLEKIGDVFCTITDAEGNVILRTHDIEKYGDNIASQAVVRAAMNGEALVGIEDGTVARMAIRAGTPIWGADGNVIGTVAIGIRLDTEEFVDSISKLVDCEIGIFLGDERIATTILKDDGTRAIGTKADVQVSERALAGEVYEGQADILGRDAVTCYMPIDNPDGRVIGMIFVGQYVSEMEIPIHAFVRNGMLYTVVILAAFVIVILIIVSRIVTPIRAIAGAATALASGDTDMDIQVSTHDEMRTLADAFNDMIENTRHQIRIVEQIAAGGAESSIEPRSEKDVMNRALKKLNDTLCAQDAATRKMIDALKERDNQLEIALSDARAANQAKSNFLAHMSHEMRTPLNAVIGLSELTLSEERLSNEAESNLEKIYGAGSTILSIVNDILDISKIESGKIELHPVEYDMPSFINDIVTLNIVRIGEKPITFKLYVDEKLPGTLFGDDLRVKQVFNNLLSNAFKYTNEGMVEWRVSFTREGEEVCLVSSVTDTGIGIRPEDADKLFTDYGQVDIGTNRSVEGTGLGLSIARRIVEMMGGAITMESEYGKGTTFHVRLWQKSASDTVI